MTLSASYHTLDMPHNPWMAQETILDVIPVDMLARYHRFEISSREVALALGFHPVAVRRAIKRAPRPEPAMTKSDLIAARKNFRSTLGDMMPRDIARVANVSLATANRIRAKYRTDK